MTNNSSARYLHVFLSLPQTATSSSMKKRKRGSLGREFTNWNSVLTVNDHVTLQEKRFQHEAQEHTPVPYYNGLPQEMFAEVMVSHSVGSFPETLFCETLHTIHLGRTPVSFLDVEPCADGAIGAVQAMAPHSLTAPIKWDCAHYYISF